MNCGVISVERKRHARDWRELFLIGGFYRYLAFVSSSSCTDEYARKFLICFHLPRSRRGENLTELRNSVWNELCTTMGHATTKMNAHFVPRFFICLQAVNTHRDCLLAHMLVPLQDFPFLASWGMVIKNISLSGDRRGAKLSIISTNSANKIFCVKEVAAVYMQTFSKLLVFCHLKISLWKQPSFFAPSPNGVSRNATQAGSKEGRLFSQAVFAGYSKITLWQTFCARIVDICLFQVVISYCCGKLNHADICQCGGDFNT